MPRDQEQTTIAVLPAEKKALAAAKAVYEQRLGRRLSAGEFVRTLCEMYLKETAQPQSPVAAQQVEAAEASLISPGPVSYQTQCPRCGRPISWPVAARSGYCPYTDCRVFLVKPP